MACVCRTIPNIVGREVCFHSFNSAVLQGQDYNCVGQSVAVNTELTSPLCVFVLFGAVTFAASAWLGAQH